jgi:predicted O-linked N-acetylglucosamine transferase (SPINDLY family)
MRNNFNQTPRTKPKVGASINSAMTQQILVRLQQGLALHDAGQFEQAKAIYEEILKLHPEHFDSIVLLGAIAIQTKQWVAALDLYAKALIINPNSAIVFCNQSIALKELKRFEEALASYDKAIELKHDYAEAYNNRGNVLKELKRFAEALASYDKAIEISGDYAEAHYNRGNVLNELKLLEPSLASYDRAIEMKRDYSEVYLNRGNVLKKLNRFDEALVSYDKAIELKPDDAEAYLNRGNVLKELKRFDEALISYDKAVEFKSDYAEAYFNLGKMLNECKLLDEELACYKKAIELKPDYEYLFGTLLHAKMHTCCWQEFEENIENLSLQINLGKKSSPSFPVLGLIDSLSIQHKASEIWVSDKYPFNTSLGAIPKYPRKEKIRIGYFSSDFHNHATAYLMAELFERHDKTNFECIAFSFGPDLLDEMRVRLMKAFDQFIDVQFKRDKDIASLSREMNIDIAVDLKGVTDNNKTEIFSYRAAPIQVNYIGYPGTMAAEYMDYIIADPTLIPEESQQYYSEKIVYLPKSYQVNDRERKIATTVFTKEDLGLPKDGFVFCCFNNNYKITPPIFDGWIRILKAVEGSVLWLLEDNPTAGINLRKEAQARGLDPSRLVFANRMQSSEHLARHRTADLFIDTLPCNAHTTASDALWAGLPVLTCMGKSFASRVAASLLNAIDLPELVTTTQEQYEVLAIELATNPEKLKAIKDKLEHNRLTTALFDTPRYTLHIEAAYKQMYERYQAGLSPDNIYVEDSNDHWSSYNSVDVQ